MKKLLAAALASTILFSGSAYAQTSDIIVTARKVEENINAVPTTVRYYSEQDLAQQGIIELNDLPGIGQRSVPQNADGLVFSMRGQTQNDVSITVDSAVGTYVDGNYIGRGYGINTRLLDTKNVQILSGPQGTLFGRNTTGGAILIETNDPTLASTEMTTSFTYGRFNEIDLTNVINAPVTDNLAVRIAGSYRHSDGFTTDRITNERYNRRNTYHVRGKILFEPSDDIRSVLSAEYYENNGNLNPRFMTYGYSRLAPLATPNPGDTVSLNSGLSNYTDVKSITWNSEIGNFKINTSWRDVSIRYSGDFDGTPSTVYNLKNNVDIDQYTAEVLYRNNIGSLDYTVGGFYFNETGKEYGFASYYGGLNNTLQGGRVNNTSYGAFLNGSYDITDRLILNGGVRFTHDDKRIVTNNSVTDPSRNILMCLSFETTPGLGCALNQRASFEKWTWTAGLDYRINDATLFYGKVSTGYKSGGNQIRAISVNNDRLAFNPENITEYELGVKGSVGSVDYSVAGFYNETDNMQVLSVVTQPFVYTLVANAAKARSYGIDAQIAAQLTDNFRVRASGTWVDPKFLEYVDPVSGANLTSNRFNNVTRTQITVDGIYTYDIFTLNANYSWVSRTDKLSTPKSVLVSRYGNVEGTKIYNTTVIPSYGILNLRASADLGYGEIALWGRNVLNTRIEKDMTPLEGLFNTSTLNDPATYGVTFTLRF